MGVNTVVMEDLAQVSTCFEKQSVIKDTCCQTSEKDAFKLNKGSCEISVC